MLVKLEASHPFTATTNSGVVANGEDASGLAAGVLPKLSSQKNEKWWVVYKVNPEMDMRR
jgi:hypothetical protein